MLGTIGLAVTTIYKLAVDQRFSAFSSRQGRIQGVSLAVMTGPYVLQVGYSVLKPMIKYQALSLQASNAGGLEQATAYIFLTLHSTTTKQQGPCLVSMVPAQ